MISAVKHFVADYGRAGLLALLMHGLLLALLLTVKFSHVPSPPVTEAIVSFLYQPPPVMQEPLLQSEANIAVPAVAAMAYPGGVEVASVAEDSIQPELEAVAEKVLSPVEEPSLAPPVQGKSGSLAQRALNMAATSSPDIVNNAAVAGYQQFMQAQQQPKITVEKRHQQQGPEPEKQVLAQLDNGLQLLRTKDGCRIADPNKEGFDALMAARRVPCGDEIKTGELLRQALEKHRRY